jgi:hypothetical protein
MSDRYDHMLLTPDGERYDNLLTLARHLAFNAAKIELGGGLCFHGGIMETPLASPQLVSTAALPLPPLAFGPGAGIAAAPGEDWDDYCGRAFGIRLFPADPFCHWLQSPLWRRTELSAKGAGLRIAYALDCGVPHDHVEIAMGHAWTDYDHTGFIWDILKPPIDLLHRGDDRPIRTWPAMVGSVERARRQAAVTLGPDTLRQSLINSGRSREEEMKGLDPGEIRFLLLAIGSLPQSLRDVLERVGAGAGRLSDKE